MSDLDNKLLLELADESRRGFLKKLGKGMALATSGIKPDINNLAGAVAGNIPTPSVGNKVPFDAYDAVSYALDNMFEFGRAESNLSMPLEVQRDIGKQLQYSIIGHKYSASPGGPSALSPTDRGFAIELIDNADEYDDMDEAIASASATLQDVFDYPKIFKEADNIWKMNKIKSQAEKEIRKKINNHVQAYIDADNVGDTGYKSEPEPVVDADFPGKDPRDYQERDYASGPHMNSFKPVMSFNDFYLNESLWDNINKAKKKGKVSSEWKNDPKYRKEMKKQAKKIKDEDETDEEMPMTVFAGPGEVEAANKGKKMRKKIAQQPNVAGAPEIINNPGPNYTNQPSLGQVKNRTYKNKNLVSGVYKTNV
tara:strand:- start:5031 stop:6131 length:1101 start_codon:yes stop_codon:yes gene_type:complete